MNYPTSLGQNILSKPIQNPDQAKSPFLKMQTRLLFEENPFIKDWLLGERNPKGLISELNWLRAYKTDYELACLEEANLIAVKGHMAAEAAFKCGASEFEINMAYLKACQQTENQMPYGNIVALNEHAAILHYQQTDITQPNQFKSFLIDAGVTNEWLQAISIELTAPRKMNFLY